MCVSHMKLFCRERVRGRTVVALVLVLHRLRRLSVPVVALRVMLRLAVVALVLVHRLGVVHPRNLRRLGVAVAALVLVRRLRVVLGLACADIQEDQLAPGYGAPYQVASKYVVAVAWEMESAYMGGP